MDLLRTLARPTLASVFVIDGLDAALRPKRHVEKFEEVSPALEKLGLPPVLSSDAALLTRLTGAVSVVAGVGLATGTAPRTCATVLAALNLPLAIVNNPVWKAKDANQRAEYTSGLLQSAALGGGLMLASVDRVGQPSLKWRVGNYQAQRAAISAAKDSVRAKYEPEAA